MKTIFKLFFVITHFIFIFTQNGIKIDISEDVLEGFEKQFLPIMIDELEKINITSTLISVDVKIGTLYVNISDISIIIQNIKAENILLSFQEPNLINAKSQGIKGRGAFKTELKFGLLSYAEHIFVSVKNVNVDADLKLICQESQNNIGKMLPSAYISRVDIDVDFDFNIYGNYMVETFIMITKSTIKEYINYQLRTRIKDIIIEKSKEFIAEQVKVQPVYVPINYKNLMLDVSLLSPPSVLDRNLIIHVNGTLIKNN